MRMTVRRSLNLFALRITTDARNAFTKLLSEEDTSAHYRIPISAVD
jgi:hypothetical protein